MVYKFARIFFFETRCTKFASFCIGMCTVFSVHFVCTHYGQKVLAALININPRNDNILQCIFALFGMMYPRVVLVQKQNFEDFSRVRINILISYFLLYGRVHTKCSV